MPEAIEAKAYKLDAKAIKLALKTSMSAAVVDKENWDTEKDAKRSLLKLHGVTEEEYRRAGGTL